MNPYELYDNLMADVEHTFEEWLKYFSETGTVKGECPIATFEERGHKLSTELTILGTKAMIQTFYLEKDAKIFNQFNKTEIKAARINAAVDDKGQVFYSLGSSNQTYKPDEFVKSHLKKPSKETDDFITAKEKGSTFGLMFV